MKGRGFALREERGALLAKVLQRKNVGHGGQRDAMPNGSAKRSGFNPPTPARGRAVIVAGARLRPGFLRSVVQPDDFLICADGGWRRAAQAGLEPQVVIGDMDSCPAARAAAPAPQAAAGAAGAAKPATPAPPMIRHPREKDFTDLELALNYALEAGFREILIVGAVGGRLDHTLANVHLLLRAAHAGAFACLAFPGGRLWALVGPARRGLEGRPGDIVSLIPLSPEATGVRTEGLRYPLRGETLRWDQGRGVSNRLVAGEAEVSLDRGSLAVIHLERGRRGRGGPGPPGRGGVEPPENGGAGVPRP